MPITANWTAWAGWPRRCRSTPGFSTVAFFANLGLPGLCGFVGEVAVLMGAFAAARPDSVLARHAAAAGHAAGYHTAILTVAVIACLNLVITAGYMLWALQRVYLGPGRAEYRELPDVTRLELSVLAPLAAMAVLLGVLPMWFVFSLTHSTVGAMFRLF